MTDQTPPAQPAVPDDATAADFTRWSANVREVHAALMDLHQPCEDSFLAIGAQLTIAHRTAHQMAETSQRLAEMFKASWMIETIHKLERDLQDLNRLLDDRQEQSSELRQIKATTQAIDAALRTLQKIVTQVRMLATNARIEASQLDSVNIDFGVFTREIGRLGQRGEKTIDDMRASLQTLRATLDTAEALQNDFREAHQSELDAISKRLSISVGSLHERQEQAHAVMERIPTDLEDAGRTVSRVVSDLQVSDMTRQRVEHVEHALETLDTVLVPAGRACPIEGDLQAVFIHGICDLQERQLRNIGRDFEDKALSIHEHLRSLGTKMHGLQNTIAEIHAPSHGGSEGNFLMDLEVDLDRTETILDQYRKAREEMEHHMGHVATMAGNMATILHAIHDIDAEMHLIGLNASIKCGNIGTRGRALNVVAGELQELARQTQGLARTISQQLDTIQAASGRLESQGNDGSRTLMSHLDGVLRESIVTFDQVGTKTTEDMEAIEREVRTLVASIDQTLSDFTIRDHMMAVFTRAADDLSAIARQCQPGLDGPALDEARRDLMMFLQKNYTMVSERDVHDALFSDGDAATPSDRDRETAKPSGTTGEVDLSDILF